MLPFLLYLLLSASLKHVKRHVQAAAGMQHLHLRSHDGLKCVHPAEGGTSHHLHASLHVSLLIAPVGITEAVRKAVCGLQPYQRVSRVLSAYKALHGHPHVVVYHAVRHMPDFPEEPTVRLQEGLRILVQEEVGRTVVAVGHREYSHVQLDAPAVYGEIHLAPVKLTVLSRLVALADEALLRLLRMPQCGADVLADGRIADLEAGIAHCRMDVARLHTELPVTPLALLLIVTKAYVDERTHLVSEDCPLPLGHLVRGLALQVGSKGLVPSGLG